MVSFTLARSRMSQTLINQQENAKLTNQPKAIGTTPCISEKTRFTRGCFRRWFLVGVRSPVPTGLDIWTTAIDSRSYLR